MEKLGFEFQNGNWGFRIGEDQGFVELPSWAAWRPTLRTERGRVGHPVYMCDLDPGRWGGSI